MSQIKFLPDGRLPTRQDLDRAIRVEPALYMLHQMYARNELTWEECLMGMILYYVDLNRFLSQSLITASFRQHTVIITKEGVKNETPSAPSTE
jgi:hypothetical protein